MKKYDVFISYSNEEPDKTIAKDIAIALKQRGLSAFFDKTEIDWGDRFAEKLSNAIKNCQYIIFCLSTSFSESNWCKEELNIALTIANSPPNTLHILPLLIEDNESVLDKLPLLRGRHFRKYDNARSVSNAVIHLGSFPSVESEMEWTEVKGDEFSISKLMENDSWLDDKRKGEIANFAISIIPSLKKHRSEHLHKLKESWKKFPTLVERKKPAWKRVSPTDSNAGYRLIIGFRNHTCDYRKTEPLGIGCFNCGYYAGAGKSHQPSSIPELTSQLKNGLKYAFFESNKKFDAIEFLNDGSFLDDEEFKDNVKDRIFDYLSKMQYIKRVLVESRPEHVYSQSPEIPDILDNLRDDQNLEVGIGLETKDDFIRSACIHKGFKLIHFERAVETIARINKEYNNRCSVVAYILIKPAFLKTGEVITDVMKTLRYLNRLSSDSDVMIIPKLEPAAISDGTLLSLLYSMDKQNKIYYAPLNYWKILEIITRAYYDENCKDIYPRIRIGAREDMDEIIKVPAIYRKDGRFDQFDFIVYDAIQNFNRHHNLDLVYGIIEEIYKGKNLSKLLGQRSSLKQWISNELSFKDIPYKQESENSAILTFFENRRKQMKESVNKEKKYLEAHFLKIAFDAMDIIEGYADDSPEIISQIKAIISKETSIKSIMINKRIAKILSKIFYQRGLKLFHIEVIEVSLDSRNQFLRIFFEASDFISNRCFPLWSEVDLKIGSNH